MDLWNDLSLARAVVKCGILSRSGYVLVYYDRGRRGQVEIDDDDVLKILDLVEFKGLRVFERLECNVWDVLIYPEAGSQQMAECSKSFFQFCLDLRRGQRLPKLGYLAKFKS